MKKYFSQLFLLASLLFLSQSCSNNKPEKTTDEFTDTTTTVKDSATLKKEEMLDFKFFYTLANLPSPIEMINAIYQNKVPFSKELLNPPDNF